MQILQHLKAMFAMFDSVITIVAQMRTGDSEASHISANKSYNKIRHRSKAIAFILFILQIFVFSALLRSAVPCNLPVTGIGAARNLDRYEFRVEIDTYFQPAVSQLDFHESSSFGMHHLHRGALSYIRKEFSHASAVSFAACARLSDRCTPNVRDTAVQPPSHANMPEPTLHLCRESRAAERMQLSRRPKLSRSVEVENYE
jgi:hypothetical protein